MHDNKGAILAQKGQLRERKNGLRWLVFLSAMPLFGVVAAFGIAPQTETHRIPVQTVIENISLPVPAQNLATDEGFWREEKIQRGDSVASLLSRLNVQDQDALAFLKSAGGANTLQQLMSGRMVQAKTSTRGELLLLRYFNGNDRMFVVEKNDTGFKTTEQAMQLEPRMVMKSGEIKSSLFAATDAANLPDNIAVQMADIFSTDVDFHQDLRKGDKFTVVYEAFFNEGELIRTGHVLAAEFVNAGKSYRAIYFQDRAGRSGYFTPEGKNMRKAFLRSPLEFSRISSGFTTSRFHPVLKEWRAHKGIDYAAPTGTPARATADGTVAFIGKQNGFGNLIILQHQGKYSTAYGHLSGFAKGLRPGSRVAQGSAIGFVGMTGLATGPHLHYEFRVAGVQRNPFSIPLPSALPVAAQHKKDFQMAAKPLLARLELLHGTNLASLD